MKRSFAFVLYGSSLLVHGAFVMGLTRMDGTRPAPTITRIEMRSVPKPPPPAEELAPPPPPVELPQEVAQATPPPPPPRPEPRPQPQDTPPPAAQAAPVDFGVSLGNMGGPGGPGGIAVPVGSPAGEQAPRVTRTAERQVERTERDTSARRPQAANSGCDEPDVKPRALSMPRAAYTDAARAAGIEGRVRLEVSVDENGQVTSKRVLAGLGYGLDESALAAIDGVRFEPARRCGTAISTTATVGLRFTL